MQKKITVILSLAFAIPVAAAEKPFDPETRALAIAPFLGGQTIALAHVDVTRVDVERLAAMFTDVGYVAAEEIAPLKQAAQPWIVDFKRAGGKEIYLLANAEDVPQPFSVVVPVEGPANANSLLQLLRGPASAQPRPFQPLNLGAETAENVDGFIFAGSKAALARYRTGKPASRPEVAQAFAAAGDTAVQLLLVPTPDIRRTIEEIIPTLPAAVGDGPSTTLTHGFLWAAVGVDGPPKASLRLVVQSKDATSANSFHTLLENSSKALAQAKQVRRSVPNAENILPLLVPTVAADRLTLKLDPGEQGITRVLTALAPLVTQHAHRDRCVNNLKQIVLALHNYHDSHSKFPGQASFDSQGKPLLSWRVHILPFLGEEKLYKEFHLDEPWDGEHNKQLIPRMPAVYRCPGMKWSLQYKTTYLGPVNESAMFTGKSEGVPIKDVEDGTSNTIFIVDADDDHAVIWTKPEDLKYDPKNPRHGLVGHHDDLILTAFVDGSVQALPDTIDNATLLALFTRKGGEVVSLP
jgi:hypothetical protein